MTMTEKLRKAKKNSKKGFTLVELVIVIAVLAIIAEIAIPTITTTLKSAQISAMQSDGETLETFIKECASNIEAGLKYTYYGEGSVPATEATVADVCFTNDFDSAAYPIDGEEGENFFSRKCGAVTFEYVMADGQLLIKGADDIPSGANVIEITADTKIMALINE